MQKRFRVVLLTAWLLLVAACSADPTGNDNTTGKDIDPVDTPVLADTVPDSTGSDGTTVDAGPDLLDLGLPELDVALECPGSAGCSCIADGDCNTGLCVETAEGLRCGSLCGSNCPDGFVCRSASLGGDPVSYCAPVGVRQCSPCQTNNDCNASWSAPAQCVSAGEAGSFCASVCSVNADCPDGLQCVALAGLPAKVCAPAGGLAACTCSAWATAAGASTTCLAPKDGKVCPGTRQCSSAGLGACTAVAGEACADAGCVGAKDGTPCDDADPCSQSECQAGECTVTDDDLCQCQTTADCPDDANLCNGKRFCDKSSAPYQCKTNPASVVQCPAPPGQCQLAVCLPDTGTCTAISAPDLTTCDDGAACTIGDICVAGTCQPGTVTCSCAKDSDCTAYEDGNLCNGKLFCNKAKGQCQINPASIKVCPTGLDTTCKSTVCEPVSGQCTQQLAPSTTLCEDGNPCSGSDHCDSGECVSNVAICPCVADGDCASKEDGNLCNGTLYCDLTSNTCQLNPKTVVTCPVALGQPCAPIECSPATGVCAVSPVLAGSCEDGDPCTAPGSCQAGQCVQGPGLCQCKTSEDCAVFDDGNPCNGNYFCDTSAGVCKPNLAAAPVCPQGSDPCLWNQCDPDSGTCQAVQAPDGSQCQDGEPCTKNDRCEAGQCQAGVSVCACIIDADCAGQDDGDPCNGWWFCDKTDGPPQCVFNAQPQSSCVDVVDGADVADGGLDDGEVAASDVAADTDTVQAGDAAQSCDLAGDCSVVAPSSCPDPGDLAIEIDNAGIKEVVCAHDYPAWGIGPDSPDSLTDNGDGTVVDGLTGLQWEKAPDGQTRDWATARSHCDALVLAGKADWRLPTVVESESLLNFASQGGPTTPTAVQIGPDPSEWTASTKSGPDMHWVVGRTQGFSGISADGNKFSARCVRVYKIVPGFGDLPRFDIGTASEAVLDKLTSLAWQRQPPTAGGDGTGRFTWQDAPSYCNGLVLEGSSDWRLPSVRELRSLVITATAAVPPLDVLAFGTIPMLGTAYYWTSSPFLGDTTNPRMVDLESGASIHNLQTTDFAYRVLCVRDAPTCGDGKCTAGEAGECVADCGCASVTDATPCDDGNPCTTGDSCDGGTCVGTALDCSDGYSQSVDSCDPTSGQCVSVWPEVCNGLDDNGDGSTDNAVCGGGQICTCTGGVTTCAEGCTSCPDPGDLAIAIDDAGVKKVVCAHDYPAWGIAPESPDSLTDNGDGTIGDSLTGLQWQKQMESGAYTWQQAMDACDGLVLADNSDWRLPTSAELESIVDFTLSSSPKVAKVFSGTPGTVSWTVTPRFESAERWYVLFTTGTVASAMPTGANRMRCVRTHGTSLLAQQAYTGRWKPKPANEVVADMSTGLVWQRQAPTTLGDGNGRFTWPEATNYCASLNLADSDNWRIPTIRELRSIVATQVEDKGAAVDPQAGWAVPVNSTSWYWSATQGSATSDIWVVDMSSGFTAVKNAALNHRLVCVREPLCGDGKCEPPELGPCASDCDCEGAATLCDDGQPCTQDSCEVGVGCSHSTTGANGATCVATSADCPIGACFGGTCYSKANEPCEKDGSVVFCEEIAVGGLCNSAGQCKPDVAQVADVPLSFACADCDTRCVTCLGQSICLDYVY